MFFDDIAEQYGNIVSDGRETIEGEPAGRAFCIKDAILFKLDRQTLNNSIEYATKNNPSNFDNIEIKYARTPFDNTFFQFGKDAGHWVFSRHFKDNQDFYKIIIVSFGNGIDDALSTYSFSKDFRKSFEKRTSVIGFDLKEGKGYWIRIAGKRPQDIDWTQENKYAPQNKTVSYTWLAMLNVRIITRILTILNCSNVEKKLNTPFGDNSKIQRIRRKNGKLPLASYYTIELNLKKSSHASVPQNTTNDTRIHICRGHFKEYSKSAPLFGKYIGLWWWQPQVRGNKDYGVIHKDYLINKE